MQMRITHDTHKARLYRAINPGYGYCGRCGIPWEGAFRGAGGVKYHVTRYTSDTGCFPLCEGCWELLGCAEARIEYYVELVRYWDARGCTVEDDVKRDIYQAVANGL